MIIDIFLTASQVCFVIPLESSLSDSLFRERQGHPLGTGPGVQHFSLEGELGIVVVKCDPSHTGETPSLQPRPSFLVQNTALLDSKLFQIIVSGYIRF